MKCPKCKSQMEYYYGGWGSVRLESGDGASLAPHWSCRICGTLIEAEESPELLI